MRGGAGRSARKRSSGAFSAPNARARLRALAKGRRGQVRAKTLQWSVFRPERARTPARAGKGAARAGPRENAPVERFQPRTRAHACARWQRRGAGRPARKRSSGAFSDPNARARLRALAKARRGQATNALCRLSSNPPRADLTAPDPPPGAGAIYRTYPACQARSNPCHVAELFSQWAAYPRCSFTGSDRPSRRKCAI